MAMEKVFGRHRAEVKTLAGVYGKAYEGDTEFEKIQSSVEQFATEEGRRPRMGGGLCAWLPFAVLAAASATVLA